MSRRTRVWLLVCWLGALAARTAHADTAVETRFFDSMARQAYAKGHYREALHAFLQANAVTPSPRALYNIALCAQLAHEPALAFAYFDEYLRGTDTDPARRSDAAQRLHALEAKLAVVRVESDPPGATIVVDRAELGSFGQTPRRIVVDPGDHTIIVKRAGYADQSQQVTAKIGTSATVELAMKPILGSLSLDIEPPGATVHATRNGEQVALPDHGRVDVPVGRYHVRVTAPGHAPVDGDVTVRHGATSQLALAAPALPVPTGRLVVGTSGVAARVLVDGRAKAVTPATLDAIAVGEHRVWLAATGYYDWRGTIRVEKGKTAFVNVTLRKLRP